MNEQKVYKERKDNNNSIFPGNLQRLPDESFFRSTLVFIDEKESENSYPIIESKNFLSSAVVKTLTEHCSLKCKSFDQIGMSNSKASAKNGTSVLCEINFSASNSKECDAFLNSIKLGSKEMSSKNVSLSISDLEQIKSEYFDNSSNISLGADNSNLYSFSNLLVSESDLNNENITLVSTTNFILNYFCLSDIDFFNSRPSFIQSSSVNAEFWKSFSNLANTSSCFILLANASLANSLQLSHANCSIFFFMPSGIDRVMLVILPSYMYDMFNMYKDISHIYKPFGLLSNILSDFKGGKIRNEK